MKLHPVVIYLVIILIQILGLSNNDQLNYAEKDDIILFIGQWLMVIQQALIYFSNLR